MKKLILEKLRAKACFNKKGFTLVELLIVIVIIGVLASIGIVSYKGTQAVARDSQRKSDLQAIGTAYKMHYQDKKAWLFNNKELAAIGASANCEGSNIAGDTCGAGWFNYKSSTYIVSIAHVLFAAGYISKEVIDPQLDPSNSANGTTGSGAKQYMKYFCYQGGSAKGIALFAKLEKTKTVFSDSNSASLTELDQCTLYKNGTYPLGTWMKNNSYGMNYGIIVK
ncbi:hypothetical protein COT78_01180 [Candidatus Berkelbacteria bacterium CG10_big_fil_rev_8_21_14_0_10_43_13]|uniref:Type II secretion system protein GspG C-terminal domain-containing protein n=1 Tax=Candidatus Berkelbacteria bacterium CG10_big_fil_rev_8_21_14_0_10_43_13 TaxID=1974514 RepID=A0A2H0W6V3_9BACT|nr:MAG: hypothetical protein COT78_01180 [Candidatus Berkelbacteria bacterium CG10_big_fil_rev_8_21_14_0_10_43_13]